MPEKPLGVDQDVVTDPENDGVEVDLAATPATALTSPEKPVEQAKPAEPEVEVEDDPLYKKPDWRIDPATNVEDVNDKDYGPKVQKRIGKLRASLSEAAKQRDKASKERDDAINFSRLQLQKIQQLEAQLASGSVYYTERQAEAEEANSRTAEQALTHALAAGDAAAIAKANRELAAAQAKAVQFRQQAEQRKLQLQQFQQPQQQPVYQQQFQQPQPVDSRLAKWQSENAWFQTDQEMTDAAYEIHDKLAARGVRLGSDTYYQELDNGVRERFPDYFGVEKPAHNGTVSKPSSPVTASTRTAATSQQTNGSSPNKVKLSASQIATATRLGLTPQQYAQTLVRLRSEGVNV